MLIVASSALEAMERHAQEGYPHEVCGLLVGRVEEPKGERVLRRALEAHRARNLNQERAQDRYDLDPKDNMRIEREAETRGLTVVGVYHSHPDHPSAASETDRARAELVWEEFDSWSYVILEVARGEIASWRSWVLIDRQFLEEETLLEEETRVEAEVEHDL